ncbi:hypothetical protein AHAS_Ahas07G0127300 [Arachis hypogaea]
MVRGRFLDFSPESVRLAFNLPLMQGDPHPYTRRVNFNQRLDQVLPNICLEGAQWKRDSQGKPVARGWLEFIQRSIIPTSNRSKVTIDRAIMIHCIMIGSEVEVHEVILQELYKIAEKPSTKVRLAFPHIICHLCNSVRIVIKGDIFIEKDKPITKKRMEQTGEHAHEPVQPPQQEILRIPQGMQFPPQGYWDQLHNSLGELNTNMEQLRLEHQEHSTILNEIREDQRAMREEQQRQGRDIEEIKHYLLLEDPM